jgi:hypothetical protein
VERWRQHQRRLSCYLARKGSCGDPGERSWRATVIIGGGAGRESGEGVIVVSFLLE